MILKRLLEFGIGNGLFNVKKLKDLPKSCCPLSEIMVIDFDKTKDIIVEDINKYGHNINPPKSCDALKIFPEKNRLDFIELKSMKNFIEHQLNNKTNNEDEMISEQVEKFNFKKKVKDSMWLIDYILRQAKFCMTQPEETEFDSIENQYYIVVDIAIKNAPRKELALTLDFLSNANDLDIKIDKIYSRMNDECIQVAKKLHVDRPKIIYSEKFEQIYDK